VRGRIRSIKPEVADDEELWDLGAETGLPVFQYFTVLWCYADREGRFEWRPRALEKHILPYWDGDMNAVPEALASKSFIIRYTVNGKDYGLVRKLKAARAIAGIVGRIRRSGGRLRRPIRGPFGHALDHIDEEKRRASGSRRDAGRNQGLLGR
jgi:hypothetical protein